MKLNSEMCNAQFESLNIETKRWIICIVQEMQSASEKHPDFPKDHIHAAAIVCEESGELIRAALQYKYEKGRYYEMHKEAIQTAATCVRFLNNAPELRIKNLD